MPKRKLSRGSVAWHAGFLEMVPSITRRALRAFQNLDVEARAEAVQDVLTNAMTAYVRMVRRGKVDLAFPSALARFAIAQYREGRRSGCRLNCHDVASPYAQRRKGVRLSSFWKRSADGDSWQEMLVEDRHAGPAETAAARIDVTSWFSSLPRRDRRMAQALSDGWGTGEVARKFRISPARVSQKRRELHESWLSFQGDEATRSDQELVECHS